MELEKRGRLHFLQDEKVVNDIIDVFEDVYPNDNLYVVFIKTVKPVLVKPRPNILFLKYSSPELNDILEQSGQFREIICHSLWTELNEILRKINHPNITWVVWGADMFEALLEKRGYKIYLDKKTVMKVKSGSIPSWLFEKLLDIKNDIRYKGYRRSLEKINNIALSSMPTYELFLHYYPEYDRIRVKELFYYPIEKMLDNETKSKYVSGNDIWVNNAAGYNGNHLDILKKLSTFNNLPIVHVPLSYGIQKWANFVRDEGEKILGVHFDPMMTFLPKKEYYKCFLGSNTFIFGHLRSCAFGNILIALYLGAKVFLYRENTLYDHLKRLGLVLYNINDEFSEENVLKPFDEKTKRHNKELIEKYYSYERLKSLVKNNFNG